MAINLIIFPYKFADKRYLNFSFWNQQKRNECNFFLQYENCHLEHHPTSRISEYKKKTISCNWIFKEKSARSFSHKETQ